MKAIDYNPTIRYDKARIVDVCTSADQGCMITGIKGGHKFEKVYNLGHYNGFGAFRVYGKYTRTIGIKVVVFTKTGHTVDVIEIDKDLVLSHYGKLKVTQSLMDEFHKDVVGKKIKVYWDRDLGGLELYYNDESLWYDENQLLELDNKHREKIVEYRRLHPRKHYFKGKTFKNHK